MLLWPTWVSDTVYYSDMHRVYANGHPSKKHRINLSIHDRATRSSLFKSIRDVCPPDSSDYDRYVIIIITSGQSNFT